MRSFPVTGPNAVISNVIISESFIQSNYSAGSVIGETTSNDEKIKLVYQAVMQVIP